MSRKQPPKSRWSLQTSKEPGELHSACSTPAVWRWRVWTRSDLLTHNKNLALILNTSNLVRRAQQGMLLLKKLKQAGLTLQLLKTFYRSTIESIVYQGCTACAWQRTWNICSKWWGYTERIMGAKFLDLDYVYADHKQRRAWFIYVSQQDSRKNIYSMMCIFPQKSPKSSLFTQRLQDLKYGLGPSCVDDLATPVSSSLIDYIDNLSPDYIWRWSEWKHFQWPLRPFRPVVTLFECDWIAKNWFWQQVWTTLLSSRTLMLEVRCSSAARRTATLSWLAFPRPLRATTGTMVSPLSHQTGSSCLPARQRRSNGTG